MRLHWGRAYEQIDHGASNICYIRIPAKIADKFNHDDEVRQDLFICTCFFNKHGVDPLETHFVDLWYT